MHALARFTQNYKRKAEECVAVSRGQRETKEKEAKEKAEKEALTRLLDDKLPGTAEEDKQEEVPPLAQLTQRNKS